MASANHSILAHHFEDLEQQRETETMGMWVFLATEILIFGGIFTGYTIYRSGIRATSRPPAPSSTC